MIACAADQPCPCGRLDARGRVLAYGQCCGRWLEGDAPAPDAQSLMRSRYSAYVLRRGDYLLRTWHPSQRPAHITFDAGVKWLGLEVRSHSEQDATHAQVAFVARQRGADGRAERLQEHSRFVREQGKWLYLDALLDPDQQ